MQRGFRRVYRWFRCNPREGSRSSEHERGIECPWRAPGEGAGTGAPGGRAQGRWWLHRLKSRPVVHAVCLWAGSRRCEGASEAGAGRGRGEAAGEDVLLGGVQQVREDVMGRVRAARSGRVQRHRRQGEGRVPVQGLARRGPPAALGCAGARECQWELLPRHVTLHSRVGSR